MARQEGSIKFHGTNHDGKEKWMLRLYIKTDGNGKRIYLSKIVVGNEKKARQELRKMLSDRDAGTIQINQKETLNEYLDKWMTTHKANVRQRTFDNDNDMLRIYIRPLLGEYKLSKLRPLDIQEAYTTLIEKVSASTIRRAHAVLHNALEDAVRWEMIIKNPSNYANVPKAKITKNERQSLNKEQAIQFIETCHMDRFGAFYVLLLTTGLRPSEALGLKWSDIDWENRTATIKRTMHSNRKGGGYRIEEATKTKLSNRTVVIPEPAVELLRSWRKDQAARALMAGDQYERSELVFTSEVGTPLRSDNMNKRHFKQILEDSGLPSNFTVYGLRHSYATLAILAGVPIKVVSENLGHASIDLTLRTYAHVFTEQKDEAAKKIEQFLFA